MTFEKHYEKIQSLDDPDKVLTELRLLASNFRGDPRVLELIDSTISKFETSNHKKLLVNLYGLKVYQIEIKKEMHDEVMNLLDRMYKLSKLVNYQEGLAYYFAFLFYIQKFRGNQERCEETINRAMKLVSELDTPDQYIYHFVLYSYANEQWFTHHKLGSISFFEECMVYFFKEGFYRSFTQTLSRMSLIYRKIQLYDKSVKAFEYLVENKQKFSQLPNDVQAYVQYFYAVGNMYIFRLSEAEIYFTKVYNILKNIGKATIYAVYFPLVQAYLASVYALQGKMNQALESIAKTESLVEEEFFTKNLDPFNKQQILHIFSLTKFYVHTRVYGYQLESLQDLKHSILEGLDTYYSNRIMLSEFLLDAQLTHDQLLTLQQMDNLSIKQVQHIISFLLEQTRPNANKSLEEQVKKRIQLLQTRPHQENELLVEQAFIDLLTARQWFILKRYDKIIELLEPYRAHWEELEVEELSIFIYGLLQYASYKEGNPLAAALQYRAIRACQKLGFTRLGHFLIEKFEEIKQEALSSRNISS